MKDLAMRLIAFLMMAGVVFGLSGLKMGEDFDWREVRVGFSTGSNSNFSLAAPVVLATESRFSEEMVEEGEWISYETEVVMDGEKDACSEDEVRVEGRQGRRTEEIRVIYYDGEEYDREVVRVNVEEPVTKVMAKGVKKIYKSMQTDSGTISYWCDLGSFKATAYDKNCLGCSGTTAIGMATGFGVVAVDPEVIPLGSRLYITGYGIAVAGDTGGGINGREVDLGFDEVGKWWGRREVEVYLM
jgi:3D (Asp-Asp-Asp) domain-containing protein